MHAWQYHRYGGPEVLSLGPWPTPPLGPGQVRVQVRAAALNPLDVQVRRGALRWIVAGGLPRVPGGDMAGEVLETGPGVRGLVPGDRVFGMTPNRRGAAMAEEVVIAAGAVAKLPPGLDFVAAAALPLAAQTALQGLRDLGRLRPGQRVLVNGASGGVGIHAVQIARAYGAEVLAVCSHRNVELLHSLGIETVIDYTQTDLLRLPAGGLDQFFDAYGNYRWGRVRHLLRPGGRYVTTIPQPNRWRDQALSYLSRRPARVVVVRSRTRDLDTLSGLIAAGHLRPVVDRVYPWEEAVAAYRYLESHRARGKVVLRLPGG